MTQSNSIWKWTSGILASLLAVAATMAITDHSALAVVQEQQVSQNQIINKLADNEARILDLLGRHDERIKHLEAGTK